MSHQTPNVTEEYYEYYQQYIDLAIHRPLDRALMEGMEETATFFKSIPEEKQEYSYAPNKWTPKDILLHIIDCERVFAYRALWFARTENAVIQGFEQDEFANNSKANSRTMDSLLEEFKSVRKASITLFESIAEEDRLRKGEASGHILSVRAAGYIIAGHEVHHINVIKDRYL